MTQQGPHPSRTRARFAIAAIVALAICATPSLASAKAAPKPRPPAPPQAVRGTVASVTASGFTVTVGGRTTTVAVTATTTYDVISSATLADVTIGSYVSYGKAKGATDVDRITIRPAPAKARPGPEGTVSAVDGTTLTITTAKGDVTITVAADAVVSKVAAGTLADVTVGAKVAVDPARPAAPAKPKAPPAKGTTPTVTAQRVTVDTRTA